MLTLCGCGQQSHAPGKPPALAHSSTRHSIFRVVRSRPLSHEDVHGRCPSILGALGVAEIQSFHSGQLKHPLCTAILLRRYRRQHLFPARYETGREDVPESSPCRAHMSRESSTRCSSHCNIHVGHANTDSLASLETFMPATAMTDAISCQLVASGAKLPVRMNNDSTLLSAQHRSFLAISES
ncbi:hypothetical protein BDV96DRAFT_259697 [Lophiotrema nucula]|uniref:Uncharacterized protein n=1 Tax=Lophiotrema nucula TaxID=690887 RepID=A0A6A5YP34_9PLEO|nr:hypothetical protein BDV96DRAFT_259697 [Lophiotrema nucula]